MQIVANLRSPSALPVPSEVGRQPNGTRSASAESVERGRSIVPLAAVDGDVNKSAPYSRPAAAFLAHLIATAQQAPQTRQRRRAEPTHAISLYATAMPPAAA